MTGNRSQRRPKLSEQVSSAKWASVIALGAGWLILVGTTSTLAQTNYYVNSLWGSNSYDGLQPVPVGQSGPKQQVSAAIATAASGDTIEIAQGLYQDTVWSPGSKNLALRPMGLVKLVDYDPRSADSDNDGMNDAWEAYYGFDPYTVPNGDYAPGADPDHDGFTNLQEAQLGTNPWVPNVHTPSIAPLPEQGNAGYGLFEGPVSVTLTTDTSGATIRYTLDGTAPTVNSTVYLGPVELSGTNDSTFFTVTARAFKTGCDPSDAASVWYMVMPVPVAEFIVTDTTVQGNWKGVYGADGYNLAGDAVAYPDYVHSRFSYLPGPCLWATATNDWRALLKATDTNNADRIAAGWCGETGEYFDLNFGDGQPHQVALYFLDWERLGRSLDVYIQDYYAGPVLNLDYQTVTNFAQGQYLTWNLRGHVLVIVVPSDWGNYEGVLSGIFFQPTNSPPAVVMPFIEPNGGTFVDWVIVGLSNVTAGASVHYTLDGYEPTTNSVLYSEPLLLTNNTTVKARGFLAGNTNSWVSRADFMIVPPATAEFVGMDWLTQGSWDGWYGTDGYQVIGGSASYPSYAQLTTNGTSTVTWAASTNDVRALQAAAGTTNRVAAAWYSDSTFNLALNLPYGQTNLVALYFLDWQRLGLEQSVDLFDAVSGAWLDSQEVSDFAGGQYLVWELSGPVTVQVTSLNTNFGPVVSGVFFDPLAPPLAPTGLTITSFSTNAVSLAWTNNATNAQGIRIERSEDGGTTYQVLATVGANVTNYTDTGISPYTTYAYRVLAYNTLYGDSPPAVLMPPTITPTVSPVPNTVGWNNTNVVVRFEASADAVFVTPDTSVLGETAGLDVIGVATNGAGNVAYAAVTVSIDQTPPAVTPDPTNNVTVDNSHPLLMVQYDDAMSGLNLDSLQITLDGTDVTTNFYRSDKWAVASMTNLTAATHTWVVQITDWAGNTTAVTNSFSATGAVNTNAPAMGGFDMADVIEMPDVAEFWLQGNVSDTNAAVMVSVNFGDPQPLSAAEGIFGGLVPLDWGTNMLIVAASGEQGHLSSKLLAVVRGDRYQAAVSSPAFGVFANGQAQTVTVAVSPKRDAGLSTEEDLASVDIAEQPATFVGVDGNGQKLYQATVPAPDLVAPIVVGMQWSLGTKDEVPLGLLEGYAITSLESINQDYEVGGASGMGCGADWAVASATVTTGQEQFTAPSGTTNPSNSMSCSGYYPYVAGVGPLVCVDPYNPEFDLNACVSPVVATNWLSVGQPTGAICFGHVTQTTRGYPPVGGPEYIGHATGHSAQGKVEFRAAWHYGPDRPVVVTLRGLNYAAGAGQEMNLTNVTFLGQTPIAVTTNSASFLVTVSGGKQYSIEEGSLGSPHAPPASSTVTNVYENGMTNIWISTYTATQTCFNVESAPGQISPEIAPPEITPHIAWLGVGKTQDFTFSPQPPGAPSPLPLEWTAEPNNAGTFTAVSGVTATFKLTNSCYAEAAFLPITIRATWNSLTATAIVRWDSIPHDWFDVPKGNLCNAIIPPWNSRLWRTNDLCGNALELRCRWTASDPPGRAFQLRYNGMIVGKCVFVQGEDAFFYRFTDDGARIHSTWHVVRDKPFWPDPCGSIYNPFLDSGVRGSGNGTSMEYDWIVTRYYSLVGLRIRLCRHAKCYDDHWSDPNMPVNAENQGTPETIPP